MEWGKYFQTKFRDDWIETVPMIGGVRSNGNPQRQIAGCQWRLEVDHKGVLIIDYHPSCILEKHQRKVCGTILKGWQFAEFD